MTLLREISRISFSDAEIPIYDADSRRLFVVRGGDTVEVIDLSNPTQPTPIGTIANSVLGGGPNSVAISNGIVAVAVANTNDTQNGTVQFFDVNGPFTTPLRTLTVGVLPDALTFSPDGTRLIVANEGERVNTLAGSGVSIVDPVGSVSVINIPGGQPFSLSNLATAVINTASFTSFNGQENTLRAEGVRILPGTSAANDFEPELVTVSPDSATAYVTLQENNTIAVVNLNTATVIDLLPLGSVDFSLPGNGLDPSDQDGGINIRNFPVSGLRQPDGISSFTIDGQTFLITANEGDDGEERNNLLRVGSDNYTLDLTVFPNRGILGQPANLGRLEVSTIDGNTDADPEFEQIFAFGSRSFSIFDTSGNLVFDSGDDLERLTASLAPSLFNADNGNANDFDERSDDAGPEPEGVTTGVIDGRTYAFVGLERGPGGVVVYDVTTPSTPSFVQYIRNDLDISPEGLQFISAANSPIGIPLLVVANEVSGTVTTYGVNSPVTTRNVGTNLGSQIQGGTAGELIDGTDGRDTITGFGGNDFIFGDAGNDSIDGGTNNDVILGGAGNDTLLGNSGNDSLTGDSGADTLSGGSGRDVFIFNSLGDAGDRIVDFADGVDRLAISRVIAPNDFASLRVSGQGATTTIAVFQQGQEVILATLSNFVSSRFTTADVVFL